MRSCLGIPVVLLSGCSFLTPPIEKPVIEDHSGVLGTFATVAERRMVITKKTYKQNSEDPGYVSSFCAEPPPDSTQSIASSLTAALKADASKGDSKANVSGEVAKALVTSASLMFTRSQGVQLFRDGVYNLCQAHLNGALKEGEYKTNFDTLLKTSAKLIEKEIENGPRVEAAKAAAAADAKESQERLAALVLALKSVSAETDRKTVEPVPDAAPAGKQTKEATEAKPKEAAPATGPDAAAVKK